MGVGLSQEGATYFNIFFTYYSSTIVSMVISEKNRYPFVIATDITYIRMGGGVGLTQVGDRGNIFQHFFT